MSKYSPQNNNLEGRTSPAVEFTRQMGKQMAKVEGKAYVAAYLQHLSMKGAQIVGSRRDRRRVEREAAKAIRKGEGPAL